ncbi:hypothetical protein ACH3XW_9660 [Acanthocheilonema viteae]
MRANDTSINLTCFNRSHPFQTTPSLRSGPQILSASVLSPEVNCLFIYRSTVCIYACVRVDNNTSIYINYDCFLFSLNISELATNFRNIFQRYSNKECPILVQTNSSQPS